MVSRRSWRITVIVGAALLLVGSVVHVAINVHRSGRTADFTYFYGAAKAMLAGGDIYGATQGRYLYPPFFAFVLQPLAFLRETSAAVVWAALNACFFAAAAAITSIETSRAWLGKSRDSIVALVPGAVALLLFGEKIHGNFTLGQSDALMLLGFAAVLRWMNARPLLSCVVVGASANIFYIILIFVP